ncbi:MAG: biopolymer transporter ExbD [Candidatus Accumulibacter sp.]|jgi:biopolymer transport protein ExbD|nr:biopolymer transporter ExbD [Accumulibacter sp.]
MSFGSFDSGASRPMAEINTTPLVDVMLVLLIIFLVTAPLMTQSIPVALPQASAEPTNEKPETIRLSLDGAGTLFWNDTPFPGEGREVVAALEIRLRDAAENHPGLEVRIEADRDIRYQRVAEVMAAARRAGIVKLGFITMPEGSE